MRFQAFFADEKYNCKDMFIERRVDGCKLAQTSILGPILAKVIGDAIKESVKFEIKCPMRAGQYNVTNFRANMNIPVPLPDFGKYCLAIDFHGKPRGHKGFVRAIESGGSGSLKITKS
jgi:hypothetical protein